MRIMEILQAMEAKQLVVLCGVLTYLACGGWFTIALDGTNPRYGLRFRGLKLSFFNVGVGSSPEGDYGVFFCLPVWGFGAFFSMLSSRPFLKLCWVLMWAGVLAVVLASLLL